MKRLLWLLLLLPALLTGCAVVDSQHVNLADNSGTAAWIPQDAMLYYLPSGRIRIHVKKTGEQIQIQAPVQSYVSDIQRAYYFSYQESALSEDDIKIDFTKELFLSKISSVTEDKSPAVVAKLGELAKEGVKMAATMEGGARAAVAKPDFLYDQVINPFDKIEMQRMKETLLEHAGLIVSFRADFPMDQRKGAFDASKRGVNDSHRGGIFYRPLIPYRITFSSTGDKPSRSISYTVSLPDEAPVLGINISRAAFVKNSTTIEFENGVLKQIAYKKPCEVLGFVNIPIDLSKQLLSIPGEILTLRIDQQKGETKALNAEKEYLQAQNNYLKAEMNLMQTQSELDKKRSEQEVMPSDPVTDSVSHGPSGAPSTGAP